MGKLSKSLTAIGLLLRNPWLLNKVLDDDHYWKKLVERQYGCAAGLPVLHPLEIFNDFSQTVDPFAFLDGGSLPTDLALLKQFAAGIPDCTYFEIGTWRGESVANVASVAGRCFTLNLSSAEMLAGGADPRYVDQHRYFSGRLPNVTHLEGNTLSFNFDLGRKFDLIFIDGDHHYKMVKNDTEKVFRHLVHDTSIVVWHDYARNPETVRHEVLMGILDGCPSAKHQHLFHVGHTLCAVYLPGRKGGKELSPPVRPEGAFRIDLGYRKLIP